jgi:hypothetical protein
MNDSLIRRIAILSIASLAIACSGADLLAPTADRLQGTWAATDEVPGSGEAWNLTVQGSEITGTGSWSGEACCSGTITLVGTIVGDSIHIDLTFVKTNPPPTIPASNEHFDGVLESATVLRGTISRDGGPSGAVRMQKQ